MESKKKVAFLDLLLRLKLDNGSRLSKEDIQEEVDTFMFEGHDTTTCSIAWTLFLIGNHPEVSCSGRKSLEHDFHLICAEKTVYSSTTECNSILCLMKVQEKLIEEQMELYGENGLKDDVTMEDMSKMKYLEACIKESLRLYPSVPIVGRKATDNKVVDGQAVEKGESVIAVIYKLHRNPKVWDRPNDFIPERFINKRFEQHLSDDFNHHKIHLFQLNASVCLRSVFCWAKKLHWPKVCDDGGKSVFVESHPKFRNIVIRRDRRGQASHCHNNQTTLWYQSET